MFLSIPLRTKEEGNPKRQWSEALEIEQWGMRKNTITNNSSVIKQLVIPKHHGVKLADIPDDQLSEILVSSEALPGRSAEMANADANRENSP